MKNRKALIVTVLIVAVLLLGIGYAISNQELFVSGNATANAGDFLVKFDDTVAVATSGDGTSSGTITDATTATISVDELSKVNEEAVVTYTVKNASTDLSANLTAEVTTNSNQTYFTVTSELADYTIAAGDSTTLTVKVKLVKAALEAQSANITVKLTASAAQPH